MIIEDEGDIDNNDFGGSDANLPVEVSHAYTPEFEDFMQTYCQIKDSITNSQLQSDLIEHLWERHDEGDIDNNDFGGSDANLPVEVSHAYTPEFEDFMQTYCQIKDSITNSQLQSDLIEHLWERHGD
ncbi:unnamed protein product [Ilex paraguariensis]|uniref:Uncharacterized protein n=1 Tax=Ilex paraguariensis TaxID=185542 RepID=A0ABC8RLP1_9AQUA